MSRPLNLVDYPVPAAGAFDSYGQTSRKPFQKTTKSGSVVLDTMRELYSALIIDTRE
jgi:hypothetical protein